ncbi:sugar ABC transporter substrate-binding protein [Saccharothrix sp. NPDC042600]|uniref:ABC transporter substrate-binding protein n=1 Tax=Saccharothrix TaxID=2071 RepID=UPI0033F5D77F|nr:extracellular solute-binding protein [Saccharothrix mutabilis subsp. capreolus]
MRVRAVLTAVFLLAACTTAPPERVTLTWWDHLDHSPVADQAVEALIARHHAAHPHVEIKRTAVPRAELEERLARGPRPDIAAVDVAALPRLAAASALTDLSGRFQGWDLPFVEPARDSVRSAGRYYGVPLRTDTPVLLYNRDLFAAGGVAGPPATWADLRVTARSLTGAGRWGLCLAAGAGDDLTGTFLPFLWQAGGDVRDVTGAVEALSFVDSLMAGAHPDSLRWSSTDATTAFTEGRCAMTVNGPRAVPALNAAGLDWGAAPLPAGPAGTASLVGGEAWVVGAGSPHADRAWEVLRWLAEQPDNATEFGAALQAVPNRSDTAADPGWQWDPNLGAFTTQLASARSPYTPRHPEVSAELSAMVRAVLHEGRPPADAAADAKPRLDPLLR